MLKIFLFPYSNFFSILISGFDLRHYFAEQGIKRTAIFQQIRPRIGNYLNRENVRSQHSIDTT